MKCFHSTAAFGNFNCYSTAKAKGLINFPSSLQVFALAPDIRYNGSKDKEKQKQRPYHEHLNGKNL